MLDIFSMPPDINPSAVYHIWSQFRVVRVWFAHVPVFTVFKVEILTVRLAESLNDPVLFNSINKLRVISSFTKGFCGVFVRIGAGIGPGELPFRTLDKLRKFYALFNWIIWKI